MVRPVKKAKVSSRNKNGSGKLRFAVNDEGLLVPGKIDNDSMHAPLDFTSITSREVGRQHSEWAVRHSHLIYLLGIVRSEVANLKYDLKNAQAQWMVKHQKKYKNKWAAENAAGAKSLTIREMRERLAEAESRLAQYEALASAYQSLMQAASREMSRRADERNTRD